MNDREMKLLKALVRMARQYLVNRPLMAKKSWIVMLWALENTLSHY